jgi:hypothetical protein
VSNFLGVFLCVRASGSLRCSSMSFGVYTCVCVCVCMRVEFFIGGFCVNVFVRV